MLLVIKDVARETVWLWKDGLIGKILAIIAVLIFAFILWMALYFIYWAADSWFTSEHKNPAVVVGRQCYGPWMQLVDAGNNVQVPINHPPTWYLVRHQMVSGQLAYRKIIIQLLMALMLM